jgi:hypothetical protein
VNLPAIGAERDADPDLRGAGVAAARRMGRASSSIEPE